MVFPIYHRTFISPPIFPCGTVDIGITLSLSRVVVDAIWLLESWRGDLFNVSLISFLYLSTHFYYWVDHPIFFQWHATLYHLVSQLPLVIPPGDIILPLPLLLRWSLISFVCFAPVWNKLTCMGGSIFTTLLCKVVSKAFFLLKSLPSHWFSTATLSSPQNSSLSFWRCFYELSHCMLSPSRSTWNSCLAIHSRSFFVQLPNAKINQYPQS